jgi:hypothetical protein
VYTIDVVEVVVVKIDVETDVVVEVDVVVEIDVVVVVGAGNEHMGAE